KPAKGIPFAGSACRKSLFDTLLNFLKLQKSFKKLFDPTRKGTLTVHLRAKCRPRGGCAPKRPAGQPFTLSFPPNPSAGGFIDSLTREGDSLRGFLHLHQVRSMTQPRSL